MAPLNDRADFRTWMRAALFSINMVAIVVVTIGLKQLYERSIQEAEIRGQNLVQAIDLHLGGEVDKINLSLQTVVGEYEKQTGARGDAAISSIRALVKQQKELLPETEGWSIADAEGRVILHESDEGPADFLVTNRDYFQALKTGKAAGLLVSKPLKSMITGRFIVIFARAIRDRAGRFSGIVIVSLPLWYFDQVLARFEVGPQGVMTLRDADLGLVTRFPSDDAALEAQMGDARVSPELSRLVAEGKTEGTYRGISPFDGVERIVGYRLLANAPIHVFVGISKEDFLIDWQQTSWRFVGLLALFLLVINGTALTLHRQWQKQRNNAASLLESNERLETSLRALRESQRRLEFMAYYDDLTGLPNRALLTDRMRQAMAHCLRKGDEHIAVCYLDLDGFKGVNDQWGHEAGDRVLVEVAKRFRSCVRANETVARLGGDEFVLLFRDFREEGDVERAISRLIRVAAEPYRIGNVQAELTISVGVTIYPPDGADEPDVLLRHADQAMCEAKRNGKNRMRFFDLESERCLREYQEKRAGLVAALARNELRLFYQPKVDLRSGEVVGVEALLRWLHPKYGLLQPSDFLHVIEDSELTLPVGEWILHEALRQKEAWLAQGMDMQVSVNVFALHIQRADFVERLETVLQAHAGVDPRTLELEILETTALKDLDEITERLRRCLRLGVHFSLDDFGTGYSSLTYLRQLPVAKVKIDRSFVYHMLGNTEDQALVEGIVGMAHTLGLKVVAEGVETIEHGIPLIRCGCDYAQGYGIGRPMPPEALADWLAHWRMPGIWSRAASCDVDRPTVELL
jgi:diguanylate cyclase (GGDEF)-like protein